MKQLAAVNDKDKGMKSRLRRAFSFGSAAELRRASAENNISAERAKLRKERYQNEEDAEQAAIIAKQEAAGIGAGIYSGQGGIGSTDNLSIQSAASSASIMLRKMGHGMKKGTKSIKGIFRPKSVIGVPAADGPITRPSVGQVSLVTVEAERQKVNVNVDPHSQIGGGTGYPRLERNSIDMGRSAELINPSISTNDSMSRKSIVGNDRDRAEILSSMKKGILKRKDRVHFARLVANYVAGTGTNSDSGSPVLQPVDAAPNFGTQSSNPPSTPKTEAGQPRKDDYFAKPPRITNGSTRSLPTTPHGGMRNISFSPRIQFHDAWSPQDYDRRGEIATCNRLTPMLAQQIKEELNSFKMV
ncbi:bud neck involved protein [Neocucurbitaria cava]|uniref:Bud neck involved protein n=1 Tax=Neocucurbitaria cava TaxID=798079 RepID=A0A9W8YDL3_9PLEO|nr:bud neck involved protein [Neocucurbitaria cava]